MRLPTDMTDLAAFDWTTLEVKRLTLRDLHDWDRAASAALVVEPVSDEAAWECTELDLRRTVM